MSLRNWQDQAALEDEEMERRHNKPPEDLNEYFFARGRDYLQEQPPT